MTVRTAMRSAARAGAYGVAIGGVGFRQLPTPAGQLVPQGRSRGTFKGTIERHLFPPDG